MKLRSTLAARGGRGRTGNRKMYRREIVAGDLSNGVRSLTDIEGAVRPFSTGPSHADHRRTAVARSGRHESSRVAPRRRTGNAGADLAGPLAGAGRGPADGGEQGQGVPF